MKHNVRISILVDHHKLTEVQVAAHCKTGKPSWRKGKRATAVCMNGPNEEIYSKSTMRFPVDGL